SLRKFNIARRQVGREHGRRGVMRLRNHIHWYPPKGRVLNHYQPITEHLKVTILTRAWLRQSVVSLEEPPSQVPHAGPRAPPGLNLMPLALKSRDSFKCRTATGRWLLHLFSKEHQNPLPLLQLG